MGLELSKEATEVFHKAISYAADHKYEFVTPEMILLQILDNGLFSMAFEECGGNIGLLAENLESYISEYIDVVKGRDTHLSLGTRYVLNFAGQSAANSRHIHQ